MPDEVLLKLSLERFLDRLASDVPTPGGGSVAALVGALAAGLGQMSCAFTVGRRRFAAVEAQVREVALRLERIGNMLRRLIDEDSQAYADLTAAFQLDKADPRRETRVALAASVAAGVPFQTAALSRQVCLDLERLIEVANPRLKSDVEAGISLARSAFEAAVANVRINLPYMNSEDSGRMERELSRLLSGECPPGPAGV